MIDYNEVLEYTLIEKHFLIEYSMKCHYWQRKVIVV